MQPPKGADMSERGFQKLIVRELLEKQHYDKETTTADFDTKFCVNRADVLAFIQRTQPKKYDYIQKTGERAFFVRLDKHIRNDGIINVFRKGISYGGSTKKIRLFYPKPRSIFNQEAAANYASNIFTITQELVYSHKKTNNNRLDLTIFVNGCPLITMELKNAYTHQSVVNAIKQYKEDRDPADTIFNFGRCMVHFAVDTTQVFMTTTLAKDKTTFFPFNRGQNDGAAHEPFGSSNPLNPNGQRVAYLYEEILTKDSIANLIEKFATVVEDKEKKTKIQFFPRYHQLTVVRRLLADCQANGVGKRYLIQHSAGSGKSNSITWLALQLIGLYNEAGHTPFFNTVLVVTDRKNLDGQIRSNIKSFAQNKHIFEPITGSPKAIKVLSPSETNFSKTTHTRLALANDKKIISCTIQTFPFVLKAVADMSGKQVAIIIDEAHSSQSGIAAASLNAIFSDGNFEEISTDENGELDTEELVAHLVKSKQMLKNASYFAFTATPKNKTLETFGIAEPYRDEYGEPKNRYLAFHTYSMKQAIEEGFILDVLQNYTTYQSWYRIKESANNNKKDEYETTEANKRIRKFVEGHEIAIRDKSKIMIDHFVQSVKQRIQHKAKAMVVCRSIDSAIKYKDAFDDYLKEKRLPYKAIVAFSGKKKHYLTQKEVTEAQMNNFPDGDNHIPTQFKKDEYRFLIVANKFQTGFDEPLLHTMYVDKQLADVQAVQTLSRLNRAKKPHKQDTFVLDFYNKIEEVKAAFKPYYTTTILSEATDINKLHDLQEELDDYEIYDTDTLYSYFRTFYAGSNDKDATRKALEAILEQVVNEFKETLIKDQQIDFKSKAKTFYRTYNYLVKLMDEPNQYWEMLALFLKSLTPLLKIKKELTDENILEVIEMDSYRTVMQEEKKQVVLEAEVGYVEGIPVSSGGSTPEKVFDTLESIIENFNKRFGGDLSEKAIKTLSVDNVEELQKKEELQFVLNSDKANAKLALDEMIKQMMIAAMFEQTEIFKRYSNDETFKRNYHDYIFDRIWSQR